jgi:hypothetical protein
LETFLSKNTKGKRDLDCSYYVLRDNLKPKEQFKDVPRMLKAFEHWFGPSVLKKLQTVELLIRDGSKFSHL